MKKMFICCGVLCMALLLFCGTALAAVEVKQDDVSVTVTKDADEKVFKVTKSGVTDGQLYLVMIQKGDAGAKPTAENLYYLNVDKASASTFTMDAYPKDLDEGTYVVYLSDYAGSNGGRKQVATLTVSGGGGGDVLYGDVDGNGKVKSWDATVLACYLAGQSEFQNINLKNADCNGDGKVKSWDLTVLYCHLAGQSEFAQLPYKAN